MEGEPTGGENWTLLDKSPQAHPLGGTTNNICNKEIALLIKLRTIENIATGEATRAIASLHFFDYFNFFVSNSVYNTHNTHGFYSISWWTELCWWFLQYLYLLACDPIKLSMLLLNPLCNRTLSTFWTLLYFSVTVKCTGWLMAHKDLLNSVYVTWTFKINAVTLVVMMAMRILLAMATSIYMAFI